MEKNKMTKEELLEMVANQEAIILDLQLRLENNSNGRKSQVLELLRSSGSISILQIAKELNISTKNVSSQLTYLRTDGYQIFTDPKGRKVLVEAKEDLS
jgi:biotin operon repressor